MFGIATIIFGGLNKNSTCKPGLTVKLMEKNPDLSKSGYSISIMKLFLKTAVWPSRFGRQKGRRQHAPPGDKPPFHADASRADIDEIKGKHRCFYDQPTAPNPLKSLASAPSPALPRESHSPTATKSAPAAAAAGAGGYRFSLRS